MANSCYIDVRVIGDPDDVGRAQKDLTRLLAVAWDDDTLKQKDDGIVVRMWYPSRFPADEMEQVFEKHAQLIFLTEYWEPECAVSGCSVWAYGYEVVGASWLDELQVRNGVTPFTDVFTQWLNPTTRKSPECVAEQFRHRRDEIEFRRRERGARLWVKELCRRVDCAEDAVRNAAERKRKAAEEVKKADVELSEAKAKLASEVEFLAEVEPSVNGLVSPESLNRVLGWLDTYPQLSYADVAHKFNWRYEYLLDALRESGKFDEARLKRRPEQPAEVTTIPGGLTQHQVDEIERARNCGWVAEARRNKALP